MRKQLAQAFSNATVAWPNVVMRSALAGNLARIVLIGLLDAAAQAGKPGYV
jgi:hypothetical protein